MDDAELEVRLYPPAEPGRQERFEPDWARIHRERRRTGVTLDLLWQEYKVEHPEDGYQYSRFCDLYRRFRASLDVVMHQEHRAGEKMFVDFSGDGIDIVDRATGEVTKGELFVAVLGASSYTFAEVLPSQKLHDWIAGHVHAMEYFEGVAEITVPDNPKSAVIKPCWYEPELNPTYQDMAQHYDTAIIPARPKKPRDKAKVENAVLLAQRWILAALRNHVFFSIDDANDAVADKLEELNNRKFQKLDTTRRELYLSLDRPALKALPSKRYELAEWSEHGVHIDYHFEVDRHHYSVPFQLIHKRVDVRLTATTVEAFFKGRRVASHERSFKKGGYTTLPEHMPEAHRRHAEWTPLRLTEWASKAGPATAELASRIMEDRPHPEQGFRSCLGLMRLGKAYGLDRLEAASARALAIGSYSYKSVKSILKNGLDRQQLLPSSRTEDRHPVCHENIRGGDYYN